MQELNYSKFRNRLEEKAERGYIPLRIIFELTHNCNLCCRHCYVVPEQKRELCAKEIFSVLDGLAESGTFYIGFTGGEIFIRKDIFDILSYTRKKGLQIIILSNGTLISPKTAGFLGRLKLDKIDISLYSLKEEVFEYVTRIKGSFKKCIKAIHLLKAHHVPLCIKMPAMSMNYKEVGRIRKFAKTIKADFRFSTELEPRSDGSKAPLKYSLDREEVYNFYKKAYDVFEKKCADAGQIKTGIMDKKNLLFCNAGVSSASLSPYGDMQLCMDLANHRFSVLKEGVRGAWRRLVSLNKAINAKKDAECRSCDLKNFCEACPAKSLLFTGNMYSCIESHKQFAEFKKRFWMNCAKS